MPTKLTQFEQANTMVEHWLLHKILDDVSFSPPFGKAVLSFDGDVRVVVTGDWRVLEQGEEGGPDFVCHFLYGPEGGSCMQNFGRLVGCLGQYTKSVGITADGTLEISFGFATFYAMGTLVVEPDEDDDDWQYQSNSDSWCVEKLSVPNSLRPRASINKPYYGDIEGNWDIDEPFRDFVGGGLYRYDEAAARVIFAGRELARKSDNDNDVSYQMLGLLTVDEQYQSDFLRTNGVDVDALEKRIRELAPKHSHPGGQGRPFTEAVTKLGARTWDEARQLEYEIMSPDHILLAVLLSDDAPVKQAFDAQGINQKLLADKLREVLRLAAPPPEA